MVVALSAKTPSIKKTGSIPMLHKCANPACSVPFRSLREGKLFLAETCPSDLNASFDGNQRKLRRREHFWLCGSCAAYFTLRLDAALGMLTVPLSGHPSPRSLGRAAAGA
jgi:hypothetical protein